MQFSAPRAAKAALGSCLEPRQVDDVDEALYLGGVATCCAENQVRITEFSRAATMMTTFTPLQTEPLKQVRGAAGEQLKLCPAVAAASSATQVPLERKRKKVLH